MHLCPPRLSFVLYNPLRKALTDREKVLDEAGITHESVVLEVGAGNGFFTEALAARARKVFSIELQEGMIAKLSKRVGRFGDKVEIINDDIAKKSLRHLAADACLLYYSFHEVSDQENASLNIGLALKPGGILSIYEPAIEVDRETMQKTIRMFEDAGFIKDAQRDGLFTRFARLTKHR